MAKTRTLIYLVAGALCVGALNLGYRVVPQSSYVLSEALRWIMVIVGGFFFVHAVLPEFRKATNEKRVGAVVLWLLFSVPPLLQPYWQGYEFALLLITCSTVCTAALYWCANRSKVRQ